MADIIQQLIDSPWFWVTLIAAILAIVILKLKDDKKRPEQSPFFGVKVREEMTHKQMGKHLDVWGEKVGYTFYRGFVKVGHIIRFDPIYKYPTAEEAKEFKVNPEEMIETFAVSFRKTGIVAHIMQLFFNKYEKCLLDPKAFRIERKEKNIILDPKAYIIDDSGVWSLATKKELKIVDDLNLKKDHENIKGYVSDFPRRVSNIEPNQAMSTERTSHIYAEEEKAKKSRISSWVGKK